MQLCLNSVTDSLTSEEMHAVDSAFLSLQAQMCLNLISNIAILCPMPHVFAQQGESYSLMGQIWVDYAITYNGTKVPLPIQGVYSHICCSVWEL